jgi:hypothetical protein
MHRAYECGPAANMPVTCDTTSPVRITAASRFTCTGCNSVFDGDEESGPRAPTLTAGTPIAVLAVRAQNRSTAPSHVAGPLNTTSLPKPPAPRAQTSATRAGSAPRRSGPGRRLDTTAAASTRGPAAIATTGVGELSERAQLPLRRSLLWTTSRPGRAAVPRPGGTHDRPHCHGQECEQRREGQNAVRAAVHEGEAFLGMEHVLAIDSGLRVPARHITNPVGPVRTTPNPWYRGTKPWLLGDVHDRPERRTSGSAS